MRLLDAAPAGAEENLELDASLLQQGMEVLRFWEVAGPVVVLGRPGRVEEHVRVLACEADGVPLIRRGSGGGAVVLAAGSLNYSLVFRLEERPRWRDIRRSLREILGRLASALEVEFGEPSDLVRGDRKVSGCAQRRTANAILHHGTLLYEFDAALAERYLLHPRRQPAYRRARSHEDFLGNLPFSAAEIRRRVVNAWM